MVAVFARFIFRSPEGAPYYIIHWDFASQYCPWLIYTSDVLRTGDWPFWSPFVGAGEPFFLNPQNPLYSPLTWLVAFTAGYTQYSVQLQSFFMIFLGGVGAYQLSFALWRARVPAMVTALCFGLSAAFYGNLQHSSYINAYALMPWFFLAVLEVIRANRRWSLPLLVVTVYLLIVSGYGGGGLMTFAWGLAWAMFLLWKSGKSLFSQANILKRAIFAGLLAFGLSAVYWLPIAYYKNEFTRGSLLTLDRALTGGNLSFKHLFGFLFHFTLAQPLPGNDTDLSMRGLYLGVLALPLVAVALWRRRDAWTAALFCFSLATFLMACGIQFFGRVALHALIPALNFSRFPAGDSRTLMALGLALLAGRGLQVLLSNDTEARKIARNTIFALLALFVFGLLLFSRFYTPEEFSNGPLNYVAITALLTLLFLCLLPDLGTRFGKGAFLVLLLLDLGTAFNANIWVAGEPSGNYAALVAQHQRDPSKGNPNLPRELGTRGTLLDLGDCEPANVGHVSKQFYLGDYNPLRMVRLDRLIEAGLTEWLRSGARVVSWEAVELPDSVQGFLSGKQSTNFAIVDYRPNKVTYSIQLKNPSWVIFNELNFPGWRARWGNHDEPMVEVLGGLRAVRLEAGTHELETYFRPRIFFVGLAVSIASLVLGIFWWFLGMMSRKSGRRRDNPSNLVDEASSLAPVP
ncbi:Bacterial membrane protein YfhO [compost metagenome]